MSQSLSIKSNKPQKAVDVTAAAAGKIRELLESEGDASLALRMAVRPGGCSGFSYEMFFDSEIESDDIVEQFDGLSLIHI